MGTILASFSASGKTPVLNEALFIWAKMPDNSLTQNLIKCPGISSYPLLLVFFREFIIEVISKSETGVVKNDCG